MKNYTVLVLATFTLLVTSLTSAGSRTTRMKIAGSPSAAEATAVPGTELHDNVAYIKPGYKFVKRGDAVDVLPEGGKFKTGTYVCPCNSRDRTRKCEMVFTTRRITCRRGSCAGGSCLLTPAVPTATQ